MPQGVQRGLRKIKKRRQSKCPAVLMCCGAFCAAGDFSCGLDRVFRACYNKVKSVHEGYPMKQTGRLAVMLLAAAMLPVSCASENPESGGVTPPKVQTKTYDKIIGMYAD